MLRRLDLLRDYWLHASDGQLGAVQDFLFDDRDWRVRFMVVDPGNWMPESKVLVMPTSIARANRGERRIDVDLTCDEIRSSPVLDVVHPYARQMQERILQHFGWTAYWMGHRGTLTGAALPGSTADETSAMREDAHLRSVRELTSYNVYSADGNIGRLCDFMCDDETWTIRYLVVALAMGEAIGGCTLITPAEVEEIHWDRSDVRVTTSRESVQSSTKYDLDQLSERDASDLLPLANPPSHRSEFAIMLHPGSQT